MNRLFLLLFGVVSLVAHAQVPDYVPTEGLMGWYPFNSNANDESGNENDAIPTNVETTTDRFGAPDSAFYFDYDQYGNGSLGDMVWVPHSDEFNVPELTVSIWFRQTDLSYPGNPGHQAIVKRVETGYANPPGEFWSLIVNDSGVLTAVVHNNTSISVATNEQAIQQELWYHAVLTYNNETLDLYLNGELVGSQAGSNWMRTQGVSGISIGVSNQANGYWRPFKGDIDDLAIWDRALTDDEILGLYNAIIPVLGCTEPFACNFDPEAELDDNTCFYPDTCGVCDGDNSTCVGCMDPTACNFDSTALIEGDCVFPLFDDDCDAGASACGEGQIWIPESQQCLTLSLFDSNFDGCVTGSDLLDFLSAYGYCLEPESPEFTCGDPVSYHGYDYSTVQIGEQCWFAENLRAANYTNNDSIPSELSDDEWIATTEGATAVYGDDNFGCHNYSTLGNACDEEFSMENFGRLYNAYVVQDSRGICPSGWSVPTDIQWMELEIYLGMEEEDAINFGYRGSNQSEQLKSIDGWAANPGTNASGFDGLAGGKIQVSDGYCDDSGRHGTFWTSTISGNILPIRRLLAYNQIGVQRAESFMNEGHSIRCIKD